MTPQELKNSILQLGIQGKLVEQQPDEGNAEELYQQIKAEKRGLIKEGKIKKEKPLTEITEDDTTFDIPETWKFIRFGEICQLLNGTKLEGPSYPYLEAKYLRGNAEAKYLDSGKFIAKGTKAILVDGENSGEVFDIQEDGYLGSTFKVLHISGVVFLHYALYFLLFHKTRLRNNKKGAAIPHLNKELFFNIPFPLPPLAEQKRIVAKIEEMLPYIDRYEQAWIKLEEFNKRFPPDMQKSILQYAIQGKMVEQHPEEGTAEELYQKIQAEKQRLIEEGTIKKEKPLPVIPGDEKPFDIPESWKWVHLSDVFDVRDGTHDSPKYHPEGVPFVTSKNLKNGIIDFADTKLISEIDAQKINERSYVEDGDILFAMIGTIGNPVIVEKDREFCIKNMALIKNFSVDNLSIKYLYYFLLYAQNEMKKTTQASVQKFVSLSSLRSYRLPLPPLAEQKRIVAKLEEILPLCKKIYGGQI